MGRRHERETYDTCFFSFLALEKGGILSTPHTCLILYCCEKENFLSPSEQNKTLKTKESNNYLFLQVREVFEESPFLVPEDSVSIMDGSHEGLF